MRVFADPEALPDYEAAVEALERLLKHGIGCTCEESNAAQGDARAALARLREKVPA